MRRLSRLGDLKLTPDQSTPGFLLLITHRLKPLCNCGTPDAALHADTPTKVAPQPI